MFKRLWGDDAGAVISTEYILISGVLVFGVAPGMVALRDSVNSSFLQIGKNLESVVPKNLTVSPAIHNNNVVANTQNQNLTNYNQIIVQPRQP